MDLARELALLGAECAAEASPTDSHRGLSSKQDRWESLGRRMSAHLAIPDAYQDSLCASLGLTPTSYWLVMLCAAVELFPDAARAMADIAGDAKIRLVTPVSFALLMRSAMGLAFTKALSDAVNNASAERIGLVERLNLHSDRPLTQQPMRLTVGALTSLLGVGLELIRVSNLTVHREEPAAGPGLNPLAVQAAQSLLTDRGVLCIRSRSARAGRQLVMDLAAIRAEHAVFVTAADELPVAAELGRLRQALPALDLFSWCRKHRFPDSYVREVADLLPVLVVLVPQNATTSDQPTLEVENLTWTDAKRIWSLALEDSAASETMARSYQISLEEARAAVRSARDAQRVRSGVHSAPTIEGIAEQVLEQGARRMERVATRLPTRVTLDTLVVSDGLRQQLDDMISWVNTSGRVYDEWGLSAHNTLGKGLTCLFVGGLGTGKTLAAQALAAALRLNLYRIDLGSLVGRHPHDSERAVGRLFDDAESGHGILLFQECDGLLSKHASHVDLSYLLQRLEVFNGISILTAGMRSHIEPSILRRFHFVLDFPMPDQDGRKAIWQRTLPGADRLADDIDIDLFVDRFALSGGNIQSITLAAAHFAAAAGSPKMTLEHLVRATYRELEKMGMPRSRKDFGPLASLLDARH